jgi:predicted AAA+ superfamily ATPase
MQAFVVYPDSEYRIIYRGKLIALLKITEVLECHQLLIITRDTERMLEIKGRKIEVIPVWKWLLNL